MAPALFEQTLLAKSRVERGKSLCIISQVSVPMNLLCRMHPRDACSAADPG
jgi:hypothetical protein